MAAEEKKAEEAPPTKGGIAAFLPLIVIRVTMPALAYAMTTFVIVPKLKAELKAAAHGEEATEDGHGEAADAHGGGHGDSHGGGHGAAKADSHGGGHGDSSGHGGGHGSGSGAPSVTLDKVLVNVRGTAGTRYLIGNYTLVGDAANFSEVVDPAKPKLQDIASSIMATKTILDLEKPEARNLIRNELIAAFNKALGGDVVKEIYITDFAIQ